MITKENAIIQCGAPDLYTKATYSTQKDALPGQKKGSSLGSITVNCRGLDFIGLSPDLVRFENSILDTSNGELHALDSTKKTTFAERRCDRYMLQSAIREVLEDHRIKVCLRHRRPNNSDIEVWKHKESGLCHFGGLMVCASPWVCPCCVIKITDGRKEELEKVIRYYADLGYKVVMVTKTASHHKFDSLLEMNKSFSKANHSFFRCNPIKQFRKDLNMLGYVRSHEITFQFANGWHPHYHELWFFKSKKSYPELCKSIKEFIYPHWSNYAVKKGLGKPSFEHGIHVRDAETAWSYVSKYGDDSSNWGAVEEMTKHNMKKGKTESLTFFGIARRYIETGEETYKKLIKEYAKATHRKRTIQYSSDIKIPFDVKEKTDEELANASTESSDLLCYLTIADWKLILKHNVRSEVLELAEKGLDPLLFFVNQLKNRP